MQVDFGRTAADYARHRVGSPALLFDELAARGALLEVPLRLWAMLGGKS